MIIEDKSAESSAVNEDFDIAIPFNVRIADGEEPEITVYPSLKKEAREFAKKFATADEMLSREAIIWARDACAPFLCANRFMPDKEHEDFFIDFRIDSVDTKLIRYECEFYAPWMEFENLTGYDLETMHEYGHIAFIQVEDGKIVSAACTNMPVFDDDEPCGIEIGVETAEGFEGKGRASSVCAALVNHLLKLGHHALYESESENAPSIALAKKLGGKEIARSFCIIGTRIESEE